MVIDVIKEDGVKYYSQRIVDNEKRNAYSAGFNDGLKIELHIAVINGDYELSESDIDSIKNRIREQFKTL